MLTPNLKFSSIAKAVKAVKTLAEAAKRDLPPQYSPNRVNKRSNTLARVIAKGRSQGLEFPSKSMQICRRKATYGVESVKVSVSEHDYKKYAALHGVFMCKNSIHCPHCKAIAEAKMRKYIAEHLSPRAKDARLASVMMTITMKHEMPKNDSDLLAYKHQTDKFYTAVQLAESNSWRTYAALGGGYMYGIEAPMGENGLHLHGHKAIFFDASLLEYDASGKLKDYVQQSRLKPHLDAIIANVKAAFTKHDLHVADKCIDVRMGFDAGYIAKSGTQEIDARDSAESEKRKRTDWELTRQKDNHGRSNNREFVEYLDDVARGDEAAEREVLRHLMAFGGRRRWTIGQGLQKRLKLTAFSDWEEPEGTALYDEKQPKKVVAEIHPERFNIATELINQRPAIALILRAAKNEESRPGSVGRMVDALMRETHEARAERIVSQHIRRTFPLVLSVVNGSLSPVLQTSTIAAILANAYALAEHEIAQYHKDLADKLRPMSEVLAERIERQRSYHDDMLLRERVARANFVGYDYINGDWVKEILTPLTPAEVEKMRTSMGQELEFALC